MKNNLLKIAGIVICAVALGLNLQNAFDGYGVKKGNIHPEVLAQTNTNGGTTSGGGSTSGGGTSSGGSTSGGSTMGGGGTGWSDDEDESCQSNYGSEPRTERCNALPEPKVRSSVQRVCDRVADASKECTPVACGVPF